MNFNLYNKSNGETALFDDITVPSKDDRTNRIAITLMNFELLGASKTFGATLRKKD